MKPLLFAFLVAAHPAVVHAAEEACPWDTEDEAVAALVEKSRIRMELCDSVGDADRECAKAVSDLLEEEAAQCGRESRAEAAEADNANRCIEVPGNTYTSAGEVAYRSAAGEPRAAESASRSAEPPVRDATAGGKTVVNWKHAP